MADWDGAIGRTIGRGNSGVVVLDAEGRIALQVAGAPDFAQVSATLDGLMAPTGTDGAP